MNDLLGDDLKTYEAVETDRRLMPGAPVICRIDGRAFHTLTRNMKRPYDEDFMHCMDVTAIELIKQLRPLVGYVQSDEITLIWGQPLDFGGRIHKMVSVTAGLASAVFMREYAAAFPDSHAIPHFDSRVFQVPTLSKAVDVLYWREDDATRNSVSMLAQAHFSHGELLGKSTKEMKLMLEGVGVIWGNQPSRFKRGSYFRRVNYQKALTEEEILKIPVAQRPPAGTLVTRSEVREILLNPLRSMPPTVAELLLLTDAL